MIEVEKLTKSFRIGDTVKYVARNISARFPDRTSIGLLGRNGAGKSTFLKLLSGQMRPDSGRVIASGRISWQIGFAGSFHGDLTGAQNVRFIARAHGVDSDDLCTFVADFAELGPSFHAPFRTYSSGMRARLAFGVSMGIPFSFYLIDEVTAVGDAAFRNKCSALLRARLETAGAIVVSHSEGTLRDLCTMGAVLENGRLTWHDRIEDAIDHHNSNM
jgi:capsular polysaccharide transport system ATP-binding protein